MSVFKEIKRVDHPAIEEEILQTWEEKDIFARSVAEREGQRTFTFYEGPPTANGRPGIHHVMSRAIKDIFCRYKTMRGFQVARRAGWDTHGLPVEIEVEKALGLEGRDQVVEYGIEAYNKACRESVLKYKDQWDGLTTRMGYWVDLDDPYVTFDPSYIESVWWLLKEIYKKDLLYQGFKIQWYSPGSGTVLSSHEVSLGYKEVQDPSIFTRFRLEGQQSTFFLAWTTTPWTTVSNVALAVGKNIDYVQIRLTTADIGEHELILAEARLSVILEEYEVVSRMKGSDLEGMRYHPVFDYFVGVDMDGADAMAPAIMTQKAQADTIAPWVVVCANYVSTEDGTGIVHTAPAFGADDWDTAKKYGLPVFNPVNPDGTFFDQIDLVPGMWFKDADKVLARDLRDRGLMYRHETCVHNYPHDWRKGTPLMSYPVDSWFIRTTAIKDRLIDLNATINWQPEGIGTGRFGDWLRNNVDWALSRRRFWGTPLPIWKSDAPDSEYLEVIGSIAELRDKCGDQLPDSDADLDLHRPMVDELTWPAPDGGTMRRVEDLIDVWFDSGAMPFAQWHYPFENKEAFEKNFPADFIAEGVDQTRGWFYTLHAIGALVMDSVAYKNVVVNGLVLDEKGEKMSKSKGNAVDPFTTIEKHGVDAVRWYMMSNAPPWENLKYSEQGLVETQRKFFGTVANVYAFFATYANIDGFDPRGAPGPLQKLTEMDRWILSRLAYTEALTSEAYDQYNPTRAARAIEAFVEEFSNWYIRRNRRRFWSAKVGGAGEDSKTAAYQTVARCLNSIARMMAPIAPFYGDWLYTALHGRLDSVHLEDFPSGDESMRDTELEHRMELARSISSVTLAIRNQSSVNVRQPLSSILVVTGVGVDEESVESVREIILDEVNIKNIRYVQGTSDVVSRQAKPDFKRLGRRLGPLMKSVGAAIRAMTSSDIDSFLAAGSVTFSVDGTDVVLDLEDIEISSEGIDGWLVGQEGPLTVALDATRTPELNEEGLAREVVNRVQNLRKQAGYTITDRILLQYCGSDLAITAINNHALRIRNETLAVELQNSDQPQGDLAETFHIDSASVTLAVTRVKD